MEPKTKTKQPKDANQDTVLKAKLDRWWNNDYAIRRHLDWKWFQYDLWVFGLHYARWDKNTQQIISVPRPDGKPKIVINKVYTSVRAVRNYVLRNRPKAEVTPYNMTDANVDEAVKINQFLDYLHDRLALRPKLRGTVWHALKYSVGYWQILFDDSLEDGLGEVVVNMVDPYDLYWDGNAKDPKTARRATLAVRRVIDELKEDAKYKDFKNWDQIKPDKQISSSILKNRLIQFEQGQNALQETKKGEGSVIVKEFWYKGTEKDEGKIMLVVKAGDQIIRGPEDTGLKRIPFFRLPSDVEPMSMYGQGWVKNIIPVNRLLNMLESSLAEYNNILNKGKWISDKGAGVRVINNENGQIIEKKRGFDVAQAQIAPLSGAIFQQITNANRYIEDIGSLHDASLGRIPTGAQSGKAIEALQVGDSNNLSELVENTEEFLEDVYEYILSICADKYQVTRNITTSRETGERTFMKVIGENALNKPEGATVIPAKNMVDVKITSWLANTAEARREVLKELYEMQVIDQATLLEGYQIGNIADIIQKSKQEKQENQVSELAGQKVEAENTANANAKANAPAPAQLPGKAQAIAIIRLIIQGQVPQLPPAVGQDFVDYFSMFLQTPEAQKLPPPIIQILERTRDHAIQLVQGAQAQPPQAPQGPQGPGPGPGGPPVQQPPMQGGGQ